VKTVGIGTGEQRSILRREQGSRKAQVNSSVRQREVAPAEAVCRAALGRTGEGARPHVGIAISGKGMFALVIRSKLLDSAQFA
jgi:hypothetical protein